jgi:acyl-coenzyme A thioesterase PaaI-like protein
MTGAIGPAAIGPGEHGEPVELPWLADPKFCCFGCSPRNPFGLALKMVRLADRRVASYTTFAEHYASYPGVVHGGIVSALVDEVMGDLITLDYGLLAFSVTLRTKMLLPLHVGVPYRTVARIAKVGHGVLHTEADVTGPDGGTRVMASAAYRPIRSEQAVVIMGFSTDELNRHKHYFDHQIGPT